MLQVASTSQIPKKFSGLKEKKIFLTQVICYTSFVDLLGPVLHIVLILRPWLVENFLFVSKCSVQKFHVASSHNSLIRPTPSPHCASLLPVCPEAILHPSQTCSGLQGTAFLLCSCSLASR